eukprot:NODE_2059_length_1290_cov_26.636285_g1959_i0.p1 GENE.NODE_2059_length_1290_cov_26.636285_g1959_i0~~NODE_2059_length_1290_cov_26.636285_g1959_i0.p1  ORF type:complete len:405 (+),score=65.91 NODE_2059_length_1290_cov_26.636285_g1959_i0:5-1219(+)
MASTPELLLLRTQRRKEKLQAALQELERQEQHLQTTLQTSTHHTQPHTSSHTHPQTHTHPHPPPYTQHPHTSPHVNPHTNPYTNPHPSTSPYPQRPRSHPFRQRTERSAMLMAQTMQSNIGRRQHFEPPQKVPRPNHPHPRSPVTSFDNRPIAEQAIAIETALQLRQEELRLVEIEKRERELQEQILQRKVALIQLRQLEQQGGLQPLPTDPIQRRGGEAGEIADQVRARLQQRRGGEAGEIADQVRARLQQRRGGEAGEIADQVRARLQQATQKDTLHEQQRQAKLEELVLREQALEAQILQRKREMEQLGKIKLPAPSASEALGRPESEHQSQRPQGPETEMGTQVGVDPSSMQYIEAQLQRRREELKRMALNRQKELQESMEHSTPQAATQYTTFSASEMP